MRSDELELPNNEDLKRDSTVREVRQRSKASKVGTDIEAFNLLLCLERLPPVEIDVPVVDVESTKSSTDGLSRNLMQSVRKELSDE